MIEATRDDREAAANFVLNDPEFFVNIGQRRNWCDACLTGECDNEPIVQTIARHRVAAQEAAIRAAIEAAAEKVIPAWGDAAANSIRALSVEQVIERAMTACANAGHPVGDHFQEVFPQTGKNPKGGRPARDFQLDRYACCLIAQHFARRLVRRISAEGTQPMTALPEGFVPHDGGPCPVPLDQEVTVLYADGGWSAAEAGFWTGWEESDQMNLWSWECAPYNRIIAYRPTQQETKT